MSTEQGVTYIEPTRAGQLKWLLCLIAFPVWLLSHALWVPGMIHSLDSRSVCESLPQLQFLSVYFFIVVSAPSVFFAAYAWIIRRAGQFPRPQAWVLFRMRVRRGWLYRWQVFGLVLMAAMLLWLPVTYWGEVELPEILFDHGC